MPHGGADPSSDPEAGGIRVITRAADILTSLSQHPEGLSLGDLAHALDLPRSTIQRIVAALEGTNLVIAASSSRGFRLGPAVAKLASSMQPFSLTNLAHPHMMEMAHRIGETVNLAVFSHGRAAVLDQVMGKRQLLEVSTLGSLLPMHATSNGKALLAAMPDRDLEVLRKQLKLEPLTKRTKTSWEALERELELVRRTGLAYDHQEYMDGVSSVATVLRTPGSETGALAIPVPTSRYKASEEKLVQALMDCRRAFEGSIQV